MAERKKEMQEREKKKQQQINRHQSADDNIWKGKPTENLYG
jgi:hypothetical protein